MAGFWILSEARRSETVACREETSAATEGGYPVREGAESVQARSDEQGRACCCATSHALTDAMLLAFGIAVAVKASQPNACQARAIGTGF